MNKLSLPWRPVRARRAAPEVRAGFPVAAIPVLTQALCVYRPEQLMNLPPLRELRLWNERFRRVPPAVWSLKELEVLELAGNRQLEELAPAVGGLRRLRSLVLRDCSALRALPDSLRDLPELETLDLAGCSALERLPAGLLTELPALRRLDLRDCRSLRALPSGHDTAPGLLVLLPEHLLARVHARNVLARAAGACLGAAAGLARHAARAARTRMPAARLAGAAA